MWEEAASSFLGLALLCWHSCGAAAQRFSGQKNSLQHCDRTSEMRQSTHSCTASAVLGLASRRTEQIATNMHPKFQLERNVHVLSEEATRAAQQRIIHCKTLELHVLKTSWPEIQDKNKILLKWMWNLAFYYMNINGLGLSSINGNAVRVVWILLLLEQPLIQPKSLDPLIQR